MIGRAILALLIALPTPALAYSDCPKLRQVFGLCDTWKHREGRGPALPQRLRPAQRQDAPRATPAAPAARSAPATAPAGNAGTAPATSTPARSAPARSTPAT